MNTRNEIALSQIYRKHILCCLNWTMSKDLHLCLDEQVESALACAWIEQYKKDNKKTLQKSKPLQNMCLDVSLSIKLHYLQT